MPTSRQSQWNLPELGDRLMRLEEDVRALEREIGGTTPNGPTVPIRKRLHELEGMRAAESAARSALSAVHAERAAHSGRTERRIWVAAGLAITLLNILLGVFFR